MGLMGRIRRRMSPMREVMSASDYRTVSSLARSAPGQAVLAGHPTRFSSAEGFLHSVREIFYEEVYRFDCARPDPFIIDAGANIGLSVRYFKQRFPDATVVAFEPDSAICALLRQNTEGLGGVTVHEAAVWTEETELTFYREGSLAGSVEIDFENKNQPVKVRAVDLKTYLTGRRVDFLKIDIEGAENAVLFDIADHLDNVGLLFFEYHSTPGKPQQLGDMLRMLTDRGFRYAINGTHGAGHPFTETVPYGFDLQMNIFCFREG